MEDNFINIMSLPTVQCSTSCHIRPWRNVYPVATPVPGFPGDSNRLIFSSVQSIAPLFVKRCVSTFGWFPSALAERAGASAQVFHLPQRRLPGRKAWYQGMARLSLYHAACGQPLFIYHQSFAVNPAETYIPQGKIVLKTSIR